MTVCVVTDRRRRSVPDQARDAVASGVELMQVRERDLEGQPLARLVREVMGIARGTAMRVVVNDRLDVALACGADGVHLRGDSIPPGRARTMTPAGFLIGRSVHEVDEARSVSQDVDYLIAGTVFETASKAPGRRVIGAAGLAAIVASVDVPVLAIGGMTLDRLAEVAATGAAGIAGIGLFAADSETFGSTLAEARRRFDSASRRS